MRKWLFRINDEIYTGKKLLLLLMVLLLVGGTAVASTDPVVLTVFEGRANSIKKDSMRETIDPVFYSSNKVYIEDTTKDVYLNTIALLIDEDDSTYISADFNVSVWVKIFWTSKNGISDSISRELKVNYKFGSATQYNIENYFYFDNARRVKVRIDSVNLHGAAWDVTKILRLENRMEVKRNYIFSCSTTADDVDGVPGYMTTEGKFDELNVTWAAQSFMGVTHYDVEWAWVDIDALDRYKTGGQFDANLVFRNNSTRVTIPGGNTLYRVPMIYDGSGYLFYRVRPVQYREDGQVVEGKWSAVGTSGITYYGYMDGHEPDLNWQVSTTYAEDGKRQTVIQYFDGTLRSRQTVTKDNTLDTARTIVAETFYDFQGRPAISILPAPTLNKVIEYAEAFNRFYTTADPRNLYDIVPVGMTICNSNAPKLDSTTGAAKYYSGANPDINLGFNKYIPNAQGYPYAETRYVQDGTGRIAAQGGVGAAFQLSSNHETKYFYGYADQRELDALFGTEVGDSSHYFKNMVRDANGQYSVSYVDMHGRTIATALAGNPPQNLQQLDSYQPQYLTKNLLTNNIVKDRSIQSATTLLVPKAGNHAFHYQLSPQSAEIIACNPNGDTVCYDCYYDLEIRITGNCGETPYIITRKNFSFGNYDTTCNTGPPSLIVDSTIYLPEGEYNITKILALSKDAQDWYRDSVFVNKNICKTLQDFYNETYSILVATSNCNLSCDSCQINLGTYEHYRAEFLTSQGVDSNLTVSYETEIRASYDEALANCNALCGAGIMENKLDMIRNQMLIDVTPDQGQYAKLDKDLNGNGAILPGDAIYAPGDVNHEHPEWEINSTRPFNIFKAVPQPNGTVFVPYRNPKDERDNTDYYKNALGQRDEGLYAILPNSNQVMLQVMTPEEFSDQFDTSWAKSLLIYHPEYCKLKIAEQYLRSSYAWDAKMEVIDTWHDADAAGWITNLLNLDPFFNGVGLSYKHDMDRLMNEDYRQGRSMWQMAWMSVNCRDLNSPDCHIASSPPYDTTSCSGDWNYVWRIFRTIYLSEKDRMVNDYLTAACPNISYQLFTENDYERRFGSYNDFGNISTLIALAQSWQTPAAGAEYGEAQANHFYEENCGSYIELWKSRLMNCDLLAARSDKDAIIQEITDQLKQICIHGSDADHPYGSSTVKPDDNYTPSSFESVISTVFHNYGLDASDLCHPYLVDFPRPYDKQQPISDGMILQTKDSCVCARLHDLQQEQIQAGYIGNLSQFIQYQHGVFIRQSFLDTLIHGCDTSSCHLYDPPLDVPFILSCNTPITNCIGCSQYDSIKTKFKTQHPTYNVIYESPADDNELNQNLLFEAFMNYSTGLSKTWWEYLQFEKQCQNYDTTSHISCKQLDSLVTLFNQMHPDTGSVAACRLAFTQFINTALGTSYTFEQIQQLFMKYCGHLPDVCEPVLDCKGFHIVIDSFYNYYGDSIRTAFNCQQLFVDFFNDYFGTNYTWPQLVDMYTKLCGGDLDVCNSVSCDRLQVILDTWHSCHNYDWLTVNCLDLWVEYFNHVMGTSYTALEIEELYLRCHIPYNPCQPNTDCKTLTHLLEGFNNANADSTACPPGVDSTCHSCFTWYINNALGTSYSYEQILLMYQMTCGTIPNVCDSVYDCKKLAAFSYDFIHHYNSDSTFNCDSLFTAQFNAAFGTSYTFDQIMTLYQLYCGQRPDVCRKEPLLTCKQINAVYQSFLQLYPNPHGYFGDSCKSSFAQYFNQAVGASLDWNEITLYYWNLCGMQLNVCDTTDCHKLGVFLHNYDSVYSGYRLPHQLCLDLFTKLFNKEFAPRVPHTWKDIRRLYDSCHITIDTCPADSTGYPLDCNRLTGAKKAFDGIYKNGLPFGWPKIFTNFVNQYYGSSFTSYDQLDRWVTDNCGNMLIDTSRIVSGAFAQPGNMDIVRDGSNYYGFMVNNGASSLIRLDYGTSLKNTPTITNLGSLGGLILGYAYVSGIDIERDGNKWIGYATNGSMPSVAKIVKLDFGSDITSTPVATNLGSLGGLFAPTDITLYKDGNSWYGFVADWDKVRRLDFGTSLDNIPTNTNLGNFGILGATNGLSLYKQAGKYYLFVSDYSLVRLDFGTSLASTPTATNLYPLAYFDINIFEDKGKLMGLGVGSVDGNKVDLLKFVDIESAPTATVLSEAGSYLGPFTISPAVNIGGTIHSFISNYDGNYISRLSITNLTNFAGVSAPDSQKIVLRTAAPVVAESLPPRLCNTMSVFPPVTVDEGDPCDFNTTLAWNAATEHYNLYVEHQKDNFDKTYQDKCLSAGNLETFTVRSEVAEYHYTLYYYDQSGNLVKTVPPAGVQPNFDSTFYYSVETAKKNGTTLVPDHKLASQYRYNTLNQVVAQISPDGGLSHFWYDRLGRLVVSQNAKQALNSKYSYTKYDAFGRMIELGQLTGDPVTQALTQDTTQLKDWFTDANTTREQITRTTYDLKFDALCGSPGVLCQANLRNRVSYTMVFDNAADEDDHYASATFFSYDIHGNVDTLLQHYNKGIMHDVTGNAYKKMIYKYDLISGKINEIAYQPGVKDQFYHRYAYDAQNRLTEMYTSHDYVYWERQVAYQYYRHGALARTEIGQLGVQGIDYAYTLQGWLKGVNSTTATNAFDIGGDGALHGRVAKDAYGFSLNFYANYVDSGSMTTYNDYASINNTVNPFAAISNGLPQLNSDGVITGRDLFNGNVRAMLVNIPIVGGPRVYGYDYDQLNRIKAMNAYDSLNLTTNVFMAHALKEYSERVSFDPNGNILSYKRNANVNGTRTDGQMDDMQYAYYAGSNRLRRVNDNVNSSYTTDIEDIEDQTNSINYKYDEIGNLVMDKAEGIYDGTDTSKAMIEWTVYGKISKVTKIKSGTTTRITYTYDGVGNRISKVVAKTGTITDSTYTWYVRDATGTVMAVYERGNDSVNNGNLSQTEVHLYGSNRVGMWRANRDVQKNNWQVFETTGMPGTNGGQTGEWQRGQTVYELCNHLGNVMVTISDRKISIDNGSNGFIDYYEADIITANDYYPFGMMITARKYSAASIYRYGFNGKENDDELKGEGNQQDYGMRVYDPRLGKFLSVDPLTAKYPFYSPYQFAGNTPILATDIDGLEPNVGTGEIKSNFVFNNASPDMISDEQFKKIQEATLNRLNDNMNKAGYKYKGGNGQVDVSGTFSNVTGTDATVTTVATRNDGSAWTFQVNIIYGNGVSNADYENGEINLYIGTDADKPDVRAIHHEYGHLLGLDDRYHEFFTYIHNQLGGGPNGTGRVDTAPMKLSPGDDDDYDMWSNLMSSPDQNGGGQVTQKQWEYVFGCTQEHTVTASFYVPLKPQQGWVTSGYVTHGMAVTLASCVFTASGVYRIKNDIDGCPKPRLESMVVPLSNYLIGRPKGDPLITPYNSDGFNKARQLWNFSGNNRATMRGQVHN